jgi:hypothetical protein
VPFDLLQRKRIYFVLLRPAITSPPPALVVGTFRAGNPPSFALLSRLDLAPSPVRLIYGKWLPRPADSWTITSTTIGSR